MQDGVLLGWDDHAQSDFGFGGQRTASGNVISYLDDGPVCCIAPTGAGKGVSFLIPLLLMNPSPAIVIDLKGELTAVTLRARMEMGHSVHILDPFGITGHTSDRLNPFDLFTLEGAQLESDSEMLAALLGEDHGVASDPFWYDTGSAMLAGLVAYIAGCADERDMTMLREMLCDEDVDYKLAVLLEQEGKSMPRFARREIVAYLAHASERTRPSVLSTARTFLKSLNTDQVVQCMEDSTISLGDVVEGKPQTIYIVMPPDKVESHRGLLRAWVGMLLKATMRRKEIPEHRTMFIIDEAAQLGKFAPLLTATTLLRGYGVQVISAWQDLAQMKSRYPQDWSTILNNSAATLAFGFGLYSAAKEYAEVMGVEPRELLALKANEAVLAVRGEGVRKVRRLDYLRDGIFAGKADRNPRFARLNGPGR